MSCKNHRPSEYVLLVQISVFAGDSFYPTIMKNPFFVLPVAILLGVVVPFQTQTAKAENGKMFPIWDSTTLEPVSLHLKDARTSEQLIALSKASNFNIFADATRFSPIAPPVSMEADQSLLDWVLETSDEEHLTWRRSKERTLLFWKEPDVVATVKALVTETEKQKPTEATEVIEEEGRKVPTTPIVYQSAPMDEAMLFFADYLQTQKGWDGQSPLQLEFKLSELPPQAIAELLRLIRSNSSGNVQDRQKKWMQDAVWLSEQGWQKARLSYASPPGGRNAALLAVHVIEGNAHVFAPIEALSVITPTVTQAPADAEEAVGTGTAPATAEFSASLSEANLSGDTALANPISLEVKAATLGELLGEMQQQSGVALEISPDLLAASRVTARAAAFPLSEVMNSLTELYGVGWAKVPNGAYRMQSELSPARAGALQVGDSSWFSYWHSSAVKNIAPARLTLNQPMDWRSQLLNANVNMAELQTPEGIAVSSLPVELRTLVRQSVEQYWAVDLMRQYYDAFAAPSVLPDERVGEVQVVVSPAQKQAPDPTRKGPRVLVSNAPVLKVALVDGNTEVYSYSIPGPAMRQFVADRTGKARQWQEDLNNRLQEPQ